MYKNGRIGMDKYMTFYNAIPRALNIFQNEAQTGNQSPYSLKISKMKEKKNTKRTLKIFKSNPFFFLAASDIFIPNQVSPTFYLIPYLPLTTPPTSNRNVIPSLSLPISVQYLDTSLNTSKLD